MAPPCRSADHKILGLRLSGYATRCEAWLRLAVPSFFILWLCLPSARPTLQSLLIQYFDLLYPRSLTSQQRKYLNASRIPDLS
jgi:hypothetical protein